MSKAEFQLAYDGPALRGGTMDVNELAYSLMAIGDLVRETNREVNGERATATVRVKSDFKKGSFEVALLLDHNLIRHAMNLLPGTVTTLGGAAMIRLLFGPEAVKKGAVGVIGSVFDLWKKLKGEKPKETIQDKGKGITIFVCGDGNNINWVCA